MKLIAATNNAHKLIEFKRILEPLGFTVLSQKEAGIHVEAEETGTTFEENAYLKAKAVYDASGLATVADDSGIAVDALNGAPGVYSARYGGPGLNDVDRYEKLLHEMDGVPDEKRTARFVCAISLILSSDQVFGFTGVCEGKIGYEPRGENGFGYDPIFMVGDKSTAELLPEEKDKISHRGQALRKMEQMLSAMQNGETNK
ncbi:MAG: RdgB/HAM1 family non-canonical purine NTP pyrophosphatase [Oscillospiraceae bacterium]|mgnify:FL=1|nr:RdgB/HAM1 family non-canonical purine NTP pyrophosphatase [Oscillospiraceae bacterium]MDY3065060.1 RdgB/HAM1 family non-canonical purine NTP pyrophosphatase [Oscillospiraceae bacterium]